MDPKFLAPRAKLSSNKTETLALWNAKIAGEMRFSSLPALVPSKMPRLARLVLSREVVNWGGDFPNASLFDRPVNNARGWDGS